MALVQLPTQVYMACLFAMLDLLLNFQHCLYTRWLVPRQLARQQEETASAVADTEEPFSELQLTAQPASDAHPAVRPLTPRSQQARVSQKCLSLFRSRRSDHSSEAASDLPGAYHMRALSSGLPQVQPSHLHPCQVDPPASVSCMLDAAAPLQSCCIH